MALNQGQHNSQQAPQHQNNSDCGRQKDDSYRACGSDFDNAKSPNGSPPALIGDGQCVTATHHYSGVTRETSKWHEGDPVVMPNGEVNQSIPLYTAVATFDRNKEYFPHSRYKNSGIYLGPDPTTKGAFWLLEQWPRETDPNTGEVLQEATPPHVRSISPNGTHPSNNSSDYYVIKVPQ
jgi:hypothetical protein